MVLGPLPLELTGPMVALLPLLMMMIAVELQVRACVVTCLQERCALAHVLVDAATLCTASYSAASLLGTNLSCLVHQEGTWGSLV